MRRARFLPGHDAGHVTPGRDAKLARAALGVLLAGAIAVRVWLMLAYPPAFLGFGDSHEYVTAAAVGVFHDVQKPAGYPIFLALLHLLSHQLAFTILVQHALGVASGVLLYGAVRRSGAPAWLALLPAAVVFFGGTGLLLEHALLADSLFAFLQALGVYAAVRALAVPRLRWALFAGLAVGASFWVKTVGLSSAVLLPVLLLACAPGPLRERCGMAAECGAVLILVVLGYVGVQALVTGYVGYEREGAWNLYGRVATFVDCSRFAPPPGTRSLCPIEALGHRRSESYFQYARDAPAVRRFGGPARAPGSADALLQRFSFAAIEHEPLAYASAIVRGLGFYVSPRAGEGYTPESIREAMLEHRGTESIQPAIARYYPGDHGYEGSAAASGPLEDYDSDTRVQGAVLIALLAAALLGTPLLSAPARSSALLFTLTALLSVILAEAGNGYDARYAYPAFGPLAAGAALGAWGIYARLRGARHAHPRQALARNPES